jgi:hypothetical protein
MALISELATEESVDALVAAIQTLAGNVAPSGDETVEVTTTTDTDGNVVRVVEHNVTTGRTMTTNYTTVVQS